MDEKKKILLVKIGLIALVLFLLAGLFLLKNQKKKREASQAKANTEEQKTDAVPTLSQEEPEKKKTLEVLHTDTFIETIMGAYKYLLNDNLLTYLEEKKIQADTADCFLYEGYDSTSGADLFYVELLPDHQIVKAVWYNETRLLIFLAESKTRDQLEREAEEKQNPKPSPTPVPSPGSVSVTTPAPTPAPESTPVPIPANPPAPTTVPAPTQVPLQNVKITEVPIDLAESLGPYAPDLATGLALFLQKNGIGDVTEARYTGNLKQLDSGFTFTVELQHAEKTVVTVTFQNQAYTFVL